MSQQNDKLITYLNFAKRINAISLGIKSILRNKNQIKIIVIINNEITDNLKKDLDYLKENFSINYVICDKLDINKVAFKLPLGVKTIGVSDENLANGIRLLKLEGNYSESK